MVTIQKASGLADQTIVVISTHKLPDYLNCKLHLVSIGER